MTLLEWLKRHWRARKICVLARKQVGVRYTFGGETPEEGFDCSGLVKWVFGQYGISLPHNSVQQYENSHGDPILVGGLKESDVLFFKGAKPPYPDHEGIYLGSGLFVEAPHTGADVRISKLDGYPGFMGARRFLGR